MTTRSEKEKSKAQQEKFQAVLSNLLKDEDNKYCVDCDAKEMKSGSQGPIESNMGVMSGQGNLNPSGPRWSSWNLGIFLCIRCAGIHRNLGVHVSKVKSVNLDSWTAEQVAMLMEMGNSRARAVYEANIPDNFRRPQTDSSLEAFIRAKYEHKKYIAREWVPPKPTIPKQLLEDDKHEKKRRAKQQSSIIISSVPPAPKTAEKTERPKEKPAVQPQATETKSNSDDLLGLETSPPSQTSNDLLGDLGDFLGSGSVQTSQASLTQTSSNSPSSHTQPATSQQVPNGDTEPNLFEDTAANKPQEKSTKDSIMALFGTSNSQQQFGVPGGTSYNYVPQGDVGMFGQYDTGGMYMPQQNVGMYGMQPQQGNMMAPNMQYQQPNMMAMPQQQPGMYGMVGVPQNTMPVNQGMYAQPQLQQMHYQQMQQQMSQMRLNGASTGMVGPQVASPGAINWGSSGNSGQTLSTNLWK